MLRKFRASLYYGYGNTEHIVDELLSTSPGDAAKEFITKHFGAYTVYIPGRYERPRSWSFGVSCSGQRLYITEL